MRRLFILLLAPGLALAKPQPASKSIDFQYVDGVLGTYRLTATSRNIALRSQGRIVTFDVKKCNEKLVAVYMNRVRSSLAQVRPTSRKDTSNRVVIRGRTFKVVRSSTAAPVLRNLPNETYYLQRLQADLCGRTRRLPSSLAGTDGDDLIYWQEISHLDSAAMCAKRFGADDLGIEFTPEDRGDTFACLE